jgi:cytochrome c2
MIKAIFDPASGSTLTQEARKHSKGKTKHRSITDHPCHKSASVTSCFERSCRKCHRFNSQGHERLGMLTYCGYNPIARREM